MYNAQSILVSKRDFLDPSDFLSNNSLFATMSGQVEFVDLLERSRAGDDLAISELIKQYEPEVRMVVRARLGPSLRPYLDSVDILQSMHRSVLIGLRNERFVIDSPRQLVALAQTIVRRKIARHWRKLRRQQRLSGSDGDTLALRNTLLQLGSKEANPQRQAINQEYLDQVLLTLKPTDGELVQLRLEGFSTVEAARLLNLDPDVTRARLSRIRKKLVACGFGETLV